MMHRSLNIPGFNCYGHQNGMFLNHNKKRWVQTLQMLFDLCFILLRVTIFTMQGPKASFKKSEEFLRISYECARPMHGH